MAMLSIDQNCHSLWDVPPKLHALAGRCDRVRHLVEDIDVAFTQVGAGAPTRGTASGGPAGAGAGALRLERERFYRSGGADWGAALFYHQFLGRLPVDLRQWEPLTGLSTKALAGQLGRSIDDLYEEFSPSDNWQLIGPSYVGDRHHHRLIGDLSVAETAGFLRQLLQRASDDLAATFPQPACRGRLEEWFARERARLEDLLARHAAGRLTDLYAGWLGEHVGDRVRLDLTSRLFALGADPARTAMLEVFLRHYDQAAGLYNQAVAEAAPYLRPLQTADGELPFFAVRRLDGSAAGSPPSGRLVRTGVFLAGDEIRVADRTFALSAGRGLPLEALRSAGVVALSGKAILLAIQARLGEDGGPLALPYRGSMYMPACHRLAAKLAEAGLLPGPLHPVVRVRFHLLDRLRELDAVVRLPPHLARAFGREELTARQLGADYAELARQADQRLRQFADPAGRLAWQRSSLGDLAGRIDELDALRRRLAEADPKSPRLRQVWKDLKPLQAELLGRTVRQIADDWQVRDVDYWDSRGPLMPVCAALGGQAFYDRLVAQADVYEERPT